MSVLITACRLMFNSFAARSSSSSMPDARSTFTLRIGPGIIMRPVLVKKRDTSLPWSARRAMASAGMGFRGLRVLFIMLRNKFSGALGIGQHCLPQNAVYPCLIAFAPLLQPCDHVGVQPHGNCLLHRPIEPAPNRIFPCVGRKLRDIRSINFIVGHRGQSRQFPLLFRSEAASRHSLRFPILSCFAHTCSVRGALPSVPKRCGSLPGPHLPCE